MIAAQTGPVSLSYDVRIRNTAVETSVTSARDCLLQVIENLKEVVSSAALETPITLHAVTPFPATMNTTFGREVSSNSLPCSLVIDCLSCCSPCQCTSFLSFSYGSPLCTPSTIGAWYELLLRNRYAQMISTTTSLSLYKPFELLSVGCISRRSFRCRPIHPHVPESLPKQKQAVKGFISSLS